MDAPEVSAESVDSTPTSAGMEVSTAEEVTPTIDTGDLLTQSDSGITPDTSNESWLMGIDEEYRSDPSVNKYQSLNEAMKGLINQSKVIGKKGIIRPGEDATPEEMGEFYNAIGRPSEPNMYKYEPIEGAPEVDQEAMTGFQEFAHNKGFNQEQFQAAIEYDLQRQQTAQETYEQERVEEISNTRRNIFDEFGEVEGGAFIRDAQSAADSLGLTDALIDAGVVNNESVIRALANANKSLGSSTMIGDQKVDSLDFDGQINELRSHEGYSNKLHPMHKEIMNKFDKLYARRYPN